MYTVTCYLGHCGAAQNRHEIFEGTQTECEEHLASLPISDPEDDCPHCGGYTGTVPVQDVCHIEKLDS